MTRFGEYLTKKSASKAGIAGKTGISRARLSELSNNDKTNLKATELYLIALAIDINPIEILDFICEGMSLKNK